MPLCNKVWDMGDMNQGGVTNDPSRAVMWIHPTALRTAVLSPRGDMDQNGNPLWPGPASRQSFTTFRS